MKLLIDNTAPEVTVYAHEIALGFIAAAVLIALGVHTYTDGTKEAEKQACYSQCLTDTDCEDCDDK